MTIYILLGADGYFGRNFQYYLALKSINFISIDKNIPDEFYEDPLIQTHILDYIRVDLNENDCVKNITNLFDFLSDNVIIINFAAVSFVDYSISHPEETINNNLNCCINGYKLAEHFKAKYIYISTDEVRVNKNENELSPYVVSKRKCEEYLKDKDCFIMRPVNLMDVITPFVKGLKQKNKCLLNNIVDVIKSKTGSVKLHKGNQKRMFMTVETACDVLFDMSENIDIVEMPKLRTNDLLIRDIVYFLQYVYKFEVEEIDNPRGIYQDETYLNKHEKYKPSSLKSILNSVVRMTK
mgnify:CR=1 FL=1